MCGFSGVWHPAHTHPLTPLIEQLNAPLLHRGPDDAGVWVDDAQGIALGHRRLAILDLSPAGHQPMHSACGRLVLVFNGEIYNHLLLRQQLDAAGKAPIWRGHSDTETLLAAIAAWGLAATLKAAVGMFALALWDKQNASLSLARDRFGEKPLYYGWVQGAFVFGSELKALRAYPGFNNPVCRQALAQYVRSTYVPAPASIYQGIFKLEPGCLLALTQPPVLPPAQPLIAPARWYNLTLERWWSLAEVVVRSAAAPIIEEATALELLEEALVSAVRLQSLADVPLGAFLSGGIDSSLITALLQRQASRPVQTFTIGFQEAGFDEAPYAEAVAAHLGTQHQSIYVSATQAQTVLPLLLTIYDEPFADSSQIPTYLVCQAARRSVTVALSGDAGDELFGGYNRYFWAARIWARIAWLPFPVRRLLGAALASIPRQCWHQLGAVLGGAQSIHQLDSAVHKLSQRLRTVQSMDAFYLSLVSEWDPALGLVRGVVPQSVSSILDQPLPERGVEDSRLCMMFRDSISYLPDDILCKVDRAAMANSLETRVPFLDHRVAELAWRLPISMKIRGNQGKWALRQLLYQQVPRALIERPKAGFALPIGQWLRGPLRDWAEHLLDPQRIETEGYFAPQLVHNVWQQHLAGRQDNSSRLWSVLMFQQWLAQQ